MEVKFNQFVRGNWKVNNSEDVARTYDIEAEVQIDGNGVVSSIVNGAVRKDNKVVASFKQDGNSSAPDFSPKTADAAEAYEVYGLILAFVNKVAEEAKNNPPYEK